MTGYPGDEHVFSVVGVVLARSPDCNLRSLVVFLCPCSFERTAVFTSGFGAEVEGTKRE